MYATDDFVFRALVLAGNRARSQRRLINIAHHCHTPVIFCFLFWQGENSTLAFWAF
jgi:hypothetical protein